LNEVGFPLHSFFWKLPGSVADRSCHPEVFRGRCPTEVLRHHPRGGMRYLLLFDVYETFTSTLPPCAGSPHAPEPKGVLRVSRVTFCPFSFPFPGCAGTEGCLGLSHVTNGLLAQGRDRVPIFLCEIRLQLMALYRRVLLGFAAYFRTGVCISSRPDHHLPFAIFFLLFFEGVRCYAFEFPL